jgi:hypothetical protein
MIASCPKVDIDPATLETNTVRFQLRGVTAVHLSRRPTESEYTCCRPVQMPYEPCSISTYPLNRFVENNPDGVPHAGSDAAHTVAEGHVAPRPLYWTVMDCKGRRVTLSQWHDTGCAYFGRGPRNTRL